MGSVIDFQTTGGCLGWGGVGKNRGWGKWKIQFRFIYILILHMCIEIFGYFFLYSYHGGY